MGYRGSRRIHLRGWIIQTSWAQTVTVLSPSPSSAPCRTRAERVYTRAALRPQHANMQVYQGPVPLSVFLKAVSAQRKYPSRNQTHWNSGNHNTVIVYERQFLPLTLSRFSPPLVCIGGEGVDTLAECTKKHCLSQKIMNSRVYHIFQAIISIILGSADM